MIQSILIAWSVSDNIIGMENTAKLVKKTVGAGCLALALGGAGLFGGAIASASSSSGSDGKISTTPPAMEISTSADEQIRTTGTQGTIESVSSRTDQCTDISSVKVDCISQSAEAAPQYRAE